LIFPDKRFFFFGVTAGTAASFLRFEASAFYFREICRMENRGPGKKTKAAANLFVSFSMILLFLLLFIGYRLNQWFFAGLVAGVALVPLILMVNSITEATGMTKNHFSS